MKQKTTQSIVAIVVLAALIGVITYANSRPEDEMMMDKGEAMMDKGESISETGEEMVNEGSEMMIEGEEMMGDAAAMQKDKTPIQKAQDAAMALENRANNANDVMTEQSN
jgi:hypothetical protein